MIICGYAGIGKSYLAHNFPNVIDLESTPFEKDWDRYFKCAKHYSDQGFLVLVSCHTEIRKRVLSLPFADRITVFPCIKDRELYKKRYEERGNTEKFISIQMTNWDEWTSEKNRLFGEHLQYMKSGETLYDTIIRLLKQNENMKDLITEQEQQPVGGNEEDKALFELLHQCVCRCINDDRIIYSERERISKTMIPFIEKLQALYLQPKNEWSEEDEENLNMVLDIVKYCSVVPPEDVPSSTGHLHPTEKYKKELTNWLKSLKSQSKQERSEDGERYIGVAESPSKTFQRVNEFEEGASYRH